ncbi:MAG: asparaginase, partial [Erysipelotrichaceae bacterium]|nr:asparaginase [Erysipelotrichaceae bacterium]
MRKILMIGTGGTIASLKSEEGLRPGLSVNRILSFIPAVKDIADISTIQACNLDSTNITSHNWVQVVSVIRDHYEEYDGFVVLHGTDTLAYSAAALSYMIQDSSKPIVLTGSQKPINAEVTDGKTNLYDAIVYAADKASFGVCIVFNGKVIAGTRARKEMAKSYNAFSSINYPVLAVIQDGILLRYINEDKPKKKVKFYLDMRDSIYVLKLIPGIKPDILPVLFAYYDCIIIESFGVGGIPQYILDTFSHELDKWNKTGKYVVITTQVVNEGSNMTVYEVGRKVKESYDLIEAYDMTLEATIAKMMWIMGQGIKDYKQVKKEFYRPINKDILMVK